MKVLILALCLALVYSAEPNPPNWDTNSVKIIDPADSAGGQSMVNSVWFENGGHNPPNHGQFSSSRYALLFKPGYHNVDVNIGFYTQALGLGRAPTDTKLRNFWSPNGDQNPQVGALDNFWRGVENLYLDNQSGPVTYAVSQASPMRRVHVNGDINLFEVNFPHPEAGYASGGYMADTRVTGNIFAGSQQQWFSRNVEMAKWNNGVWNFVYVGCQGAPATHCGNTGGVIPATTIPATPIIAEKPYIIMDGDSFKLMIPNYETNKVGPTAGWENAVEVDFSQVYVARSTDSAAVINGKLEEGLHVVLQPGIYHLSESIKVNRPGTVVLGIGMASLVPTAGQPVIEVGDVDGVRIAGLLIGAGTTKSDSLVKWGTGNYPGNPASPGVMTDVFVRVGGPTNSQQTQVTAQVMVEINSGNVIVDHSWLWRADHDIGGIVTNEHNYVASSIVVNGDNVKAYGLFAEHALGKLVVWNGDNGETYFFQSELPYDVTQAYADAGNTAYTVGSSVTSHKGYGIGVYTYFRDNWVTVPSAITGPSGMEIVNAVAVFLNGNGGIDHIVNDQGQAVKQGMQTAYLCNYGGEEERGFLQEREY